MLYSKARPRSSTFPKRKAINAGVSIAMSSSSGTPKGFVGIKPPSVAARGSLFSSSRAILYPTVR